MIKVGENISHYSIVAGLGAGGMGEVYLANDTKLDRQVAIKFLRREFSEHSDALPRFTKEAKAASSLNHPNIVTIHEIGEWHGANYLAMEFVDGQSLRDLINARKLNLDSTLDTVIQVGTALSAAHDAGIVHRDIKPENVMRRSDGLVKVLDFGLAKRLMSSVVSAGTDNEAVTMGLAATAPGLIIGTAAYMSPEQARGKPVDARTDIWSLGVVLFEMVSVELPFPGETQSDILAAILKSEPSPLSFADSDITHELEHIIKKSLAKNCEERYQVMKDMVLDLKLLQEDLKRAGVPEPIASTMRTVRLPIATDDGLPYQTKGQTVEHPVRRKWLPVMVSALVLATAAVGWYVWRRNAGPEAAVMPSLDSLPIVSWKSDLGEGDESRPRLSPDGKIVAYVASKGGQNAIWLKQIDGGEPFTRKQDDSAETSPLWSPDGGQISFFSERGGRRGIWSAPALGGDSKMLALLEARASLVHWSQDGTTIFFKMGPNLYTLRIGSGEISKLTNFEQVFEHGFSVSPDEKQIAYVDRQNDRSEIWVSDLRNEHPVRVTDDSFDDSSPIWHPDGKRIIYNSNRNGVSQICVVSLDSKRQSQLSLSDADNRVADISKDGTKILYATTRDDADLWGVPVDGGKEFQVTSDVGAEFWPDVSPNGEKLAYQSIRRSSTGGKLLHSSLVIQGIKLESKVSQLAADGFYPKWSPDGTRLAFMLTQLGSHSLWITGADGVGARSVSDGGIMFGGYSVLPYNRQQTQDYQWSADGRSLIYSAIRGGVSNIWQTNADGSGEKQLTFNDDKKLLYFDPIVSPNGKDVAWTAMTTETADKRSWSVWVISDSTARLLYQTDSILRLVGWSSSGEQLIVKTAEGKKDTLGLPVDFDILAINSASKATVPVAKRKAAYFENVALSADGKTLAFVTRLATGDAIQTMTLTILVVKTIASSSESRIYFCNLVFAPDGKTLYYGKQTNSQVISMINNFK